MNKNIKKSCKHGVLFQYKCEKCHASYRELLEDYTDDSDSDIDSDNITDIDEMF